MNYAAMENVLHYWRQNQPCGTTFQWMDSTTCTQTSRAADEEEEEEEEEVALYHDCCGNNNNTNRLLSTLEDLRSQDQMSHLPEEDD
ncbi:hypothetical protein CgunFtcFv8_023447 [Champsocephalus gunnari]|uniref:Uncharacterized protein n=1 Tax=Champsocephalus gunnari TaxID=52237 RepID=A0AAN8HL74_CHAGU|nr:hypothetical protein CgunFtcFv8_023447 [Champsocephalus gunnari]